MKNIIDWTRRRICWNTHILKWKCDWCVQFRRVSASVWGNVSFFSPVVSTEWRRRVVVLKVRFIHPTNVLNTHTEFPSSPLCRSRSPTNTRNKMYIFEHKLRTFTKRKQVVFVPEPDKTEPVYYHHLDDITHLTSSFLHVQIHSNFNSKNSSLYLWNKNLQTCGLSVTDYCSLGLQNFVLFWAAAME